MFKESPWLQNFENPWSNGNMIQFVTGGNTVCFTMVQIKWCFKRQLVKVGLLSQNDGSSWHVINWNFFKQEQSPAWALWKPRRVHQNTFLIRDQGTSTYQTAENMPEKSCTVKPTQENIKATKTQAKQALELERGFLKVVSQNSPELCRG